MKKVAKRTKKQEVIVDQPVLIQPKKTYIQIVLDKSGSMQREWGTTIAALREQIVSAKEQRNQSHEVYLSLILFNERVHIEPWTRAEDFDLGKLYTFIPEGGTALYDAMNNGISNLEHKMREPGEDIAALMITITDGEENSSRWVKDPTYLKSKIETHEGTGKWTFTYIGTENAFQVTQKFGINIGNTMVYSDAKTVGVTTTQGLGGYFNLRAAGLTASTSFYGGDQINKPDMKKETLQINQTSWNLPSSVTFNGVPAEVVQPNNLTDSAKTSGTDTVSN